MHLKMLNAVVLAVSLIACGEGGLDVGAYREVITGYVSDEENSHTKKCTNGSA
jgi:hypothetical protein